VIAADKAELYNVPLPQPEGLPKALKACLPEFGSARNPCDATAQVTNDPAMLANAIDIMLSDPVYGTMMLPSSMPARRWRSACVSGRACPALRQGGLCVCADAVERRAGAAKVERNPDVALFRSTSRCFAALAAWPRREAAPRAGAARCSKRLSPQDASQRAVAFLSASTAKVLTERASKEILAALRNPGRH